MNRRQHSRARIPLTAALVICIGLATEAPLCAWPSQQQQASGENQPAPQPATGTSQGNSGAAAKQSSDEAQLPETPQPAQNQAPQSVQQGSPQSAQSSSITPADQQAPSGAAAAKAPNVKGAPASQPAGAAIAPARQHRTRSLLIKVGLLAGAGVAVGSAVALSKASPSRPPGASSSTSHP